MVPRRSPMLVGLVKGGSFVDGTGRGGGQFLRKSASKASLTDPKQITERDVSLSPKDKKKSLKATPVGLET